MNIIDDMRYDINTLDELIGALDGPSGAANWAASGESAICNWKSRGYVPPSRHLRLLIEMKRRGRSINPELFDMTPEDFDLLRA